MRTLADLFDAFFVVTMALTVFFIFLWFVGFSFGSGFASAQNMNKTKVEHDINAR